MCFKLHSQMKNYDYDIPQHILEKSDLSWDEAQLIEYIRSHPEELNEILNLFKKDGENK